MGSVRSKQKTVVTASSSSSQLPMKKDVFTRGDFRMVKEVKRPSAIEGERLWLATLIKRPTERYIVKQMSKYQLHNYRKVELALRELEILRGSACPNIVKLLHAFQEGQYLYSVYEFVKGPSLRQLFRQRIFDEAQTKFVVCSLIVTMEYVHSHGYILSDLNPEYFLYDTGRNRLVLTSLMSLNRPGEYCHANISSRHYCSPEVLMTDQAYFEADFYGLGLLTYEMMTQQKPIPEQLTNRRDIIKHTISVSKSDLPEGWSPQAADFVVRLLVKAPEHRLGRLGSFELRKHPWLLNFDWTDLSIEQTRQYFSRQDIFAEELPAPLQQPSGKPILDCADDPAFQQQFQEYHCRNDSLT